MLGLPGKYGQRKTKEARDRFIQKVSLAPTPPQIFRVEADDPKRRSRRIAGQEPKPEIQTFRPTPPPKSDLSDLETLTANLSRIAMDPDLKQKREDDFLVRQERIKKEIEDRDKQRKKKEISKSKKLAKDARTLRYNIAQSRNIKQKRDAYKPRPPQPAFTLIPNPAFPTPKPPPTYKEQKIEEKKSLVRRRRDEIIEARSRLAMKKHKYETRYPGLTYDQILDLYPDDVSDDEVEVKMDDDDKKARKDFFDSFGIELQEDVPEKPIEPEFTMTTEQEETDRKTFKTLLDPDEAEYFKQERVEQLEDQPDEPYEDEYGSLPYQLRKLNENFGVGVPYKVYDGVVYYFEPDTERLYDVESYEDIGTWDGDGSPAVWDTADDESQHKQNIRKYTLGSEKK